jgi:hypothetical protein
LLPWQAAVVAYAAGNAWSPSSDGSDPGWMLPMALFSASFCTHLATGAFVRQLATRAGPGALRRCLENCPRLTAAPVAQTRALASFRALPPLAERSAGARPAGDDVDFFESQRPLPLEQLYSPERPRSGVVPALKAALWHVLWVETAPSPGEPRLRGNCRHGAECRGLPGGCLATERTHCLPSSPHHFCQFAPHCS